MTASGPPVRPPRTASRPQWKALVLAFVISAAIVVLLLVAGVLFVLVVFSVGTGVAAVDVDTLVLDRETRAPVPGCLLAFQPGSGPEEYEQTTERTDARGRVRWRPHYSRVGSVLDLVFRPEVSPSVWFYVGEAQGYQVRGKTESWRMWLRFREPWRKGREVVPRLELQRSLFSEKLTREGKRDLEPLPSVPADRLVNAVVRVEKDPEGRTSYRVALTVLLDREQIAVCQAVGPGEASRKAMELVEAGRDMEALEMFREVTRSRPDSVWAWRGMGSAFQRLGRDAESAEAYRKAWEVSHGDVDTLFWLANALLPVDPREAESLFRKVIAAEPSKARGFTGLGRALGRLERPAEQAEAHRKAVEIAPNDAETVRAYAFALLAENNEEAERQFRKALTLKPDDASAHVGLAYARFNLERYAEALASFEAARGLCSSCLDDQDREVEAKARRLARQK